MTQKNQIRSNLSMEWLLVALWMLLIFWFSAQPATESANLSGEILKVLQVVVERILPGLQLDMGIFHLLIRKGAHFLVYAVLGGLLLQAFLRSGFSVKKAVLSACMISVLYAASDEWHQIYVPGRAGQITDVLLDGFGSLVGILVSSRIKR